MKKIYAPIVVMSILLLSVMIPVMSLRIEKNNNTVKYIPEHDLKFDVEEKDSPFFDQVSPEINVQGSGVYQTSDEKGKYILEWTLAPGGKVKDAALADLDGDGEYGYVAVEGDTIRARRGVDIGTVYWTYDKSGVIAIVAGDIDLDGSDDIGIVAEDGLHILDSNGTPIPGTPYAVQLSDVIAIKYVSTANKFVALSSSGQLVSWDSKGSKVASIGGASLGKIYDTYVFVAKNNILRIYDIDGDKKLSRCFYDDIVGLGVNSDGGSYFIAIGFDNGDVSLLKFDVPNTIMSLWSTSIEVIPRFVSVTWRTSVSGLPYVYVAGGKTVYRLYYGYVMGLKSVGSLIRSLETDDIDENGYVDIIVSTELGEVIILDYSLGITASYSVGEEILKVLYGDIASYGSGYSSGVLAIKDFEEVLLEFSGSSLTLRAKFLTGNRFYSTIFDIDSSNSYEIVAGGEDGYLYFYSIDGILLNKIYLGGTINQIIKMDGKYVINNGSVVFVSDSGTYSSNVSSVQKIDVGDVDGDGSEEVIVLANNIIYKIDNLLAYKIRDKIYDDLVLAKCYSSKPNKMIVAVAGGSLDIIDLQEGYISSFVLGTDILSITTTRYYNDEAVIFILVNSSYYISYLIDGSVYFSEGISITPYPEEVVGMDYDADGVGDIAVLFEDNTVELYYYDGASSVVSAGIEYNSGAAVTYMARLNMDNDDNDELLLCTYNGESYKMELIDENLNLVHSEIIAGPIYDMAYEDIDNDHATELILGMSGLRFVNRRTVYIELLYPSTTGLVGWESSFIIRWNVFSEDPIDNIGIYLGSKQIAVLSGDQRTYNITFSTKGNYSVMITVTTVSGLACSVGFWYYFDPEMEPIPLAVSILSPEDQADIYGPTIISGTARGLNINVSVVIDNGAEVINATIKMLSVGKWYWEAYWDPFGYYGAHTIKVYAMNESGHVAIDSIRVNIHGAQISVWAKYDGNPDQATIGTFLPNITVVNRIYVRVNWLADSISAVYFDINGVQKAATYSKERGYWYIDIDMGQFPDDTSLGIIVEGKNGKQMSTAVMIDILPLPLWILELVERFTSGKISIEWDASQKCYVAQTDAIGLIEFLEKTGILSKLGLNFTIPKEIPIFGQKLTVLNLGVIIGFKLFITKYTSVWAKADLSGQIFDKTITVSLYAEGLFNDELELVRILINALFGITNIVTFTYQHIIPFTVFGIPGTVRLGITFSVSAFVQGTAVISGNWSIDYFLVDFNPQVAAGAWAYVDIALGLVSVGLIVSPTVDIHGIYEYTRGEGGSWGVSAALTIPYKVVLSLFYNAIKTTILSGTLGPWTWSTSSSRALPENGITINSEPFTKETLLQQAKIVSDGSQTMVVWVHGEELAYAVYNGIEWRAKLLTFDGYPKSNPTLVKMDDKWMVIWTQTDESNDLGTLRLYYSYYDGNGWTVPRRVTSDMLPEGYPKAVYHNGKVYLAYLRDADGNVSTKDWEVMYTAYDGDSWSTPKKISDQSPAASLDIATVDDKIYAVFVSDSDSDFDTPENQKLWIVDTSGAHTLLASEKRIRDPNIAEYDGSIRASWVEIEGDGDATYKLMVASIVDGNLANVETVDESTSMISQPKLVKNNGELRLFWITGEGGPDGDIDSAVYRNGAWEKDLEQRDDVEIWSADFSDSESGWYGAVSEPYLKGVHVISEDKHWYITAESIPTSKEPTPYTPPSVSGEEGVSTGTIVIGVPIGVVIGIIATIITSVERKKKFVVIE